MAFLVFAHPYPDRSRANRRLLEAVSDLPGLEVRSLYDTYPTFDIDVRAEQDALTRARVIVWQHPIYWYTVPSLLKHWFDHSLSHRPERRVMSWGCHMRMSRHHPRAQSCHVM